MHTMVEKPLLYPMHSYTLNVFVKNHTNISFIFANHLYINRPTCILNNSSFIGNSYYFSNLEKVIKHLYFQSKLPSEIGFFVRKAYTSWTFDFIV
jgi:hypothetical protein